MRKHRKNGNPTRRIIACVCIAALVICGYYMIRWNLERERILKNNAAYSALYAANSATVQPSATPAPTEAFVLTDTPVPTDSPIPTDTPVATDTPVQTDTPVPTDMPVSTDTPVPADTSVPTNTPAPTEAPIAFEIVRDEMIALDATFAPEDAQSSAEVTLVPDDAQSSVEATPLPRPTPDEDTIVLAMETPPPVQDSFADLLAANPETVGFLTIGDWMSLPVVQRANDNEFYLKHNFEGENSFAGTLFMDGSNLLVPEDEALIVYGHNMKNGTMLAGITRYAKPDFFRENAFVRFDTIYEDRTYVPFAVFSASAEPENPAYLNFRQFLFDETTFDLFVLRMKDLSLLRVPIDVRYGDKVLLLVTCEYTHENGRLIVALRQMRENETETELRSRFSELS